jgi:type II secretory pathway pseudopilin PulG
MMVGGARGGSPTGFSLLELLVATVCMAMIAGAVFSLLVGSAAASRREWNALEARRVANAAAGAVARDLAQAGAGLEQAAAVQLGGERIGYAEPLPGGGLRVVLALGTAVEITAHQPGSRYVVDAGGGLGVGDVVAAIGSPARPAGAALPLGMVTLALPVGAQQELQVAWRAAEAAAISAWGPPRALLPALVRTYDLRTADGALQLGRRNDDGARQPVADLLESLTVTWLLDTDGDGHTDASQAGAWGGTNVRACAAHIEVAVVPSLTLLPDPGTAVPQPQQAARWVTLRGCS